MNDNLSNKLLAEYIRVCYSNIGAMNRSMLYRTGERVASIYNEMSLDDAVADMKNNGIDVTYRKSGLGNNIVFIVKNSLEVECADKSEITCHMLRGFFAGLVITTGQYEQHYKKKVNCIETECRAAGHDNCIFAISE
ncbi:MAG: hypothetical protein KAH86_00310 [Methanosarcinales archaeon]|nr:hypothetical protein [Methanosarcinales archaeon]